MLTTTAVEQIRQAHRSAHPGNHNPAWLNSHKDCGVLLAEIDRLRAVNKELKKALKNIAAHDHITGCGAQLDHLFNTWIDSARAALAKARQA